MKKIIMNREIKFRAWVWGEKMEDIVVIYN